MSATLDDRPDLPNLMSNDPRDARCPSSEATLNVRTIGAILINGERVLLKASTYRGGNVAVIAEMPDGEPYGVLSVNLEGETFGPGEFAVKTYSENRPWWQTAAMSGLFLPTGRTMYAGQDIAPVWRIVAWP